MVIILSIVGISKLEVENSFINYFNKNTEIYKGMKLIDEKLGGTTPLRGYFKISRKENVESNEDDEFEDWDDEGSKMMKNTGLLKIKLKKFNMFIII